MFHTRAARQAFTCLILIRRNETHIGTSLGNLIGGTLMPDGNQLVAAVESGGATNLYLLDLHGNVIRQLTHGSAINVSPAVSFDGSQMAFASDRGGTPQVYVMGIGRRRGPAPDL